MYVNRALVCMWYTYMLILLIYQCNIVHLRVYFHEYSLRHLDPEMIIIIIIAL